MSGELKPCPFCGGDAEIIDVKDNPPETIAIQCKSGCGVSLHHKWMEREALIERWNTRAERTTQDVDEAWYDWGENVFNDGSLDDFDRFEKVYQICQEIVEPIERTCHIKHRGGLPGMVPLLECEACGESSYARQDGSWWRYCPECGARVVI